MTDKEQIMINGVDVSKCINFNKRDKVSCYDLLYDKCNEVPNCYFKQLQKEKFENLNNRQMVESAENLIYENSELYKNIKEKEQECEELKRKLSNQEQLYQNEIEIYNKSCLQLRQENDDLYLERLALNTANSGINALLEVKEQECDRYRKALEKIEKIVSGNYEILDPLAKQQISSIVNKAKGGGECQ